MSAGPLPPWYESNATPLTKIRTDLRDSLIMAVAVAGLVGAAVTSFAEDGLTGTTETVLFVLFGAIVVLIGGFNIYCFVSVWTRWRPYRRIRAMWEGRLGFEHATGADVNLLSGMGGVVWTPRSSTQPAELQWHEAHQVMEAWKGEADPVLQPSTVARWLLTGEDMRLLVAATRYPMTDAELLGYLNGDTEARAAFEFLLSLASTPATG